MLPVTNSKIEKMQKLRAVMNFNLNIFIHKPAKQPDPEQTERLQQFANLGVDAGEANQLIRTQFQYLFGEFSRGNTNCVYNAHSPYLQCAVNPQGICQKCPHFEEKN